MLRAVEFIPVEKDALNGSGVVFYFAMIAAWTGEKDLACQQLATATRLPSPLTYGHLKLMPFWDLLGGEPCFKKNRRIAGTEINLAVNSRRRYFPRNKSANFTQYMMGDLIQSTS